MSEELLRRLAMEELAGQQDRLGMHDRFDGSRLLTPGLHGSITRSGLRELQDAARQAGNTHKVRPSVWLPTAGVYQSVAISNSTVIKGAWWGDGSYPSGVNTYTWPDGTSGHAGPKNNLIPFPQSGAPYSWSQNLFLLLINGSPDVVPLNGAGAYTGASFTFTCNLLAANSAVLATASGTYTWSYASPVFTGSTTLVYGSAAVQSFNAIQPLAACSGVTGGTWDGSYYFNAALIFLLNPVLMKLSKP